MGQDICTRCNEMVPTVREREPDCDKIICAKCGKVLDRHYDDDSLIEYEDFPDDFN